MIERIRFYKLLIIMLAVTVTNYLHAQSNTFPTNGPAGIGTISPKAMNLDIGNTTADTLATVLARLSEGNTTGAGTYLGIRTYSTQPADSNSFSIEHKFYGVVNSAINFYRGLANTGGYLTFATNNGTEQMLLDQNGNLGIGNWSAGNKVSIAQTTSLSLGSFNTYALDVEQNGSNVAIGGYSTGSVIQSFNVLPLFINPIGNAVIINGSSGSNVLIGKTSQVNNTYRLDVNG